MSPIEQIFLQARLQSGNWTAGITAATKSVSRMDTEEITDWFTGPENDLILRCDPFNLFFHPLPSGHYALGILYAAQRSFFAFLQQPQTMNVRILIVSPQVLLNHNNHPIALFETLRSQHQCPLVSKPPEYLLPLVPATIPLPRNTVLLETLLKRSGAMSLAQLTQSLFSAECTLFTSKSATALSVLSVLFDLLPIPYRPELTFSTDFFFSLKNSFRLSGFSGLQKRTAKFMRQQGVPVISLERENKGSLETLDPWAHFVYLLLHTRNFGFLEQYQRLDNSSGLLALEASQPVIWSNLHEVGVSLSQAMLSGSLPDKHVSATEIPILTLEELRCIAAVDHMIPMLTVPKTSTAKPKSRQRLAERFPQFQHELVALESCLVRGMFGDETVLPTIKKNWSLLAPRLEYESKEIIQEEILATIHAVLESLDGESEQRLQRSPQLLELMVFFLQTERP
jgi:hypothetical protein